MKILLVIPTIFGGGAEQVAALLSREWSRSHEVRVVTWQDRNLANGRSFDFGVPITYAGLGVQRGLLARMRNIGHRVKFIADVVRARRPDVVFAFMDEAGIPCAVAATMMGWRSRLVVSVHHNPQWIPAWRRLLLGIFYRLPAAIVAVSQGVRDELARSLRLPDGRLWHIPNPLAHDEVTDEVPGGTGTGFLLFVGRLDIHTKGLDVLVAAYAMLPKERPRLLILGEGAGRAALEADIAARGLQNEIDLHGWVGDPRAYYRRARGFVLASRYEGWSNVLMEAMGEGCPVVATRCPYGPPEILGEEFVEWLVLPDDAVDLSEGMRRLLALDTIQRERLSRGLRERAQNFAIDRVAPRWIDLANVLVAAEGKP